MDVCVCVGMSVDVVMCGGFDFVLILVIVCDEFVMIDDECVLEMYF